MPSKNAPRFYQLMRFLSFADFALLAYEANKGKQEKLIFVFIDLALLFQPSFKIALGRSLWNIVDVAVAVFLLVSLLKMQNVKSKVTTVLDMNSNLRCARNRDGNGIPDGAAGYSGQPGCCFLKKNSRLPQFY